MFSKEANLALRSLAPVLSNVLADLCHGGQPYSVCRILQIFKKRLERNRVRHLITSFSDRVADENHPSAIFDSVFHVSLDLFKIHIVERSAHRLRQIADLWVICGFIYVAATNQEAIGNEW